MSAVARARAVVQALLEKWNARDLDGFTAPLTEDVWWHDLGMLHPPVVGRAAEREFSEITLRVFPDVDTRSADRSACLRTATASWSPGPSPPPTRPRSPLPVLLLLAACGSPLPVVELPVVRAEAHAWTGGTLLLRSDDFQRAATVRVILAGRSLAQRRLDDSTLSVVLPDTAGIVYGRVELNGTPAAVFWTTLHGFESSQPLPAIDGHLLAWPYGRGTFVGGIGGPGRSRLHSIDPASGTVTRFLDDSLFDGDCGSPMSGVGPGGGPVLILPALATVTSSWCTARSLASTVNWAVVDSFPWTTAAGYRNHVFTRLVGGHWVLPYEHELNLLRRTGTGYEWIRDEDWVETHRLAASPGGEFAVPIGGTSWTGTPVPLVRDSDIRHPLLLTRIDRPRSAVFTESGDTLFIQRGGRFSRLADSLFVIDTRTGTILSALPAALPYDEMALDIGRPWLYAITPDTLAGGVTLTVYDLRTMEVAAVHHAVPGRPFHWREGDAFLAVDAFNRRLNAIVENDVARPVAYTFSLMP